MREVAPGTWRRLARYLGLSDVLSARCWQGMQASQCPTVAAIRAAFLLHNAVLLDPAGLAQGSATPARLIQVIEDLCTQGLLTAAERVQVEDTLLAATTAEGRWKTKTEKGKSDGSLS